MRRQRARLVGMISWGLYFGYKRFGLKREQFTFLDVAVRAKPIHSVQDLVLVSLTVHLENKRDTRITARRSRNNDNLSDEPLDICRHVRGRLAAVAAMRRDHLDAISSQFVVPRIAVVSAIANQVFWLGFDHVEVETELRRSRENARLEGMSRRNENAIDTRSRIQTNHCISIDANGNSNGSSDGLNP